MRNPAAPGAVTESAELVLPLLPPQDLAAAASACRALRSAVTAVPARRAADAARGLEPLPIPFRNCVDSKPAGSRRLRPQRPAVGCRLVPAARPHLAPPQPRRLPIGPVRVRVRRGGVRRCPVRVPMWRLTQRARAWRPGWGASGSAATTARVRPHVGTGGLSAASLCGCASCATCTRGGGCASCAAEALSRGQFVCEYAGEFLTTEESRRRQKVYDELASGGKLCPTLIVIREHLPSGKACLRVNIDATKVGNVARFINHSCDGGNLHPVLVRRSGSLLPRLCFFAARDIVEGEELTFSYGDARVRSKGLPCFCGSSGCSGVLPSEET